MTTIAPASAAGPAAWISRHAPAVLFATALLTAIPVWWLIAVPVLGGAPARLARHLGHVPWVYVHALAGTVMLFSGALALWIGWTRRMFTFHRWAGGTYLVTGSVTALAALWLTVTNIHKDVALSSATGALAAAWLLTASMAFRAIRNRRIETHKEWVIRSYVLTWSFVFCRGLGELQLGISQDVSNALLWLTWIGPLMICEVALQWSNGGPRPVRARAQTEI